MCVCMCGVWGWGGIPGGGVGGSVFWILVAGGISPELFSASVPAPQRPSTRQTFIVRGKPLRKARRKARATARATAPKARGKASHEYNRSLGRKTTISALWGQRPTCGPHARGHEVVIRGCRPHSHCNVGDWKQLPGSALRSWR